MRAIGPLRRWVVLGASLAIALAGWLFLRQQADQRETLVLLLPDAAAIEQPVAQAWLDAAAEEGVPLEAMTADAFLRSGRTADRITGVVLPDTVHQRASELLVQKLHAYVGEGGRLFAVFDAALLDITRGNYAAEESRLSTLVGVHYARYSRLLDHTIGRGAVYGTRESETELRIQPGKLDFKYSSHPKLGELTTYGYTRLLHSFFRTEPMPNGARTLLSSFEGDAVVSRHPYGRGEVLFANMPLGYLKTRTDGYMLHRLLRYFALDMLRLPHLTPVPAGRGGLVLNLHIDANAAQVPLLQLEQWGWFKNGPFSMHVTAGPDTFEEGDRLGLDIDHNPVMQAFLKRMVEAGHEVGNHGGWNHNIYGDHANETNREQFEPYLELNHRSISNAIGKPARSYSAPQGNQPIWATHWLERKGFKGYYFTGDTGLGPTRSYFEGKRPARALWAFPVSNYLKIATFEELDNPRAPLTADDIGRFLSRLANYVARERVSRLFYFHPPAASRYEQTMEGLMREAQRLQEQGLFRWYTMEQLSDFMTRREKAQWSLGRDGAGRRVLQASSPESLRELTWRFPASESGAPLVVEGQASVQAVDDGWLVTAGDVTRLKLALPPATNPVAAGGTGLSRS